MRLLLSSDHHHATTDPSHPWWSRVGIAGFTCFLVKGLLWLLAPVFFALWR
jgi:hypothetical protein